MADKKSIEVSFFKPKSDLARANTRLISILVIIWAVAVFGFQFLLVGLGKPVEEQTLKDFKTLWPAVQDSPAESELQSFARVMLTTLGKNATIGENDRARMQEALAVTVRLLGPESDTADSAGEKIGLGTSGFDPLLKDQLLFHYRKGSGNYGDLQDLPAIMEKYLVHNRSFLTDTRLLGFPLHYFYTAQFLLILFIVLCIVYAKAVDRIHTRLGIEE
jgi:putative solute:sodium symporter small subunit